jgi:beta-glucosidase
VRLDQHRSRPATETVQAYISDLVTSVTWAIKELKAYRQVTVPGGERDGRHRAAGGGLHMVHRGRPPGSSRPGELASLASSARTRATLRSARFRIG